jgi:hypothetical protein
MRDRDWVFSACKAALAVAAVLLLAGDACAYVVPGPEFFGQFMTLIVWALIAFSSVLLWPVYALRKRLQTRRASAGAGERANGA